VAGRAGKQLFASVNGARKGGQFEMAKASMSRASPAATRVVSVINFFVEHPSDAFTLTELVKSLRLSRATCHALLATLVDKGYLYRKPDKSYVIGPALVAAGRIARENYSPLEIARAEMRGLADEFDAICTAQFIEKDEMVLRDRAGGISHLGWLPPIGQRVSMNSLWAAPSMSFESDEAIAQWLEAISDEATPEQREEVRAAMDAARERGYFVTVRLDSWSVHLAQAPIAERREHTNFFVRELDDDRSYQLSFILVPVMDAKGLAFVITLSGFLHEVTGKKIKQIADTAVAASQRISRFLKHADGVSPA
jgi:DNA-binding IclR family transcriptional regulator